jgi:hypothetical protein
MLFLSLVNKQVSFPIKKWFTVPNHYSELLEFLQQEGQNKVGELNKAIFCRIHPLVVYHIKIDIRAAVNQNNMIYHNEMNSTEIVTVTQARFINKYKNLKHKILKGIEAYIDDTNKNLLWLTEECVSILI